MRRAVLIGVGALLVVAAAALGPAIAQQRGGQGMRRGSSPMYLEQSWAALTFEIGISSTQIGKLRPTYQSCWKSRKDALAKAQKGGDYSTAMAVNDKIKASIDAKLKSVLTAKQLAAWKAYQAKQAAAFRPPNRGATGTSGRR